MGYTAGKKLLSCHETGTLRVFSLIVSTFRLSHPALFKGHSRPKDSRSYFYISFTFCSTRRNITVKESTWTHLSVHCTLSQIKLQSRSVSVLSFSFIISFVATSLSLYHTLPFSTHKHTHSHTYTHTRPNTFDKITL